MAEEENNNVETETDIFQQQKKTIDTLINVLEQQGATQPQVVYTTPQPTAEKQSPNYLMYIGIAIIALILFRKI